ncbi:MAG: transglutaminase TgpA family protein [Aureliella sp.]
MVRQQIVWVRRLVTVHLVLLAFLTATLVATGSNSAFLPLLVLVVGTSSLIFVDLLEWFSLHHVLAYVGMIAGTLLALSDYFWNAGSDTSRQLYSIASLLIYPEIVIMLQRKNMRLFEQMAIFLLLEIIVAALVNDNVLFGMLLIPIVLLWVSALLLLTRYSALIQLAPDLDRPTPRLVELLIEAWRNAQRHRQLPTEKMLEVVQPEHASHGRIHRLTLVGQAAPIGIVSLIFAGLYFYLLPRAASEVPAFNTSPRTGLSETITLGSMGRLLQDSSVVLRLTLRDPQTGQTYRLDEPPYIRGTVVSRYYRQTNTASFEGRDQLMMTPSDRFEALSALNVSPEAVDGDLVEARFDIMLSDGAVLPSLAPMLGHDRGRNYIQVLPFEWRLINGRSDFFPGSRTQVYTLLTSAFRNGYELPVLPDSRRAFGRPRFDTAEGLLQSLSVLSPKEGQYDDRWIDELLKRIHERHPAATSGVALARAAEMYLAASGEFSYSLAPRVARDSDMDPIEDFVVNQKRGHCQYFAAALTMILRHQHIPSRIVLGYHPLEYNELGDYFTVRRRDAHAWVEAYFTADQLKEAGLYSNSMGTTGGWLRLDPTPAGPGSNAGSELRPQADQGIDFANRVWSEWVLNSRQRAEENSLYGPLKESTRQTYQSLVATAREVIKRARDSQLVGGAIRRDNWFAWPVAILIMLGGALLVLIWKLIGWLPRWAPQLAKKLGLAHGADDVRQHFYRHCLRLLHRAGFVRPTSQTPEEYTQAAGEKLQDRWGQAPSELAILTDAYYRMRFGGKKTLPPNQGRRVNAALEELERKLKTR